VPLHFFSKLLFLSLPFLFSLFHWAVIYVFERRNPIPATPRTPLLLPLLRTVVSFPFLFPPSPKSQERICQNVKSTKDDVGLGFSIHSFFRNLSFPPFFLGSRKENEGRGPEALVNLLSLFSLFFLFFQLIGFFSFPLFLSLLFSFRMSVDFRKEIFDPLSLSPLLSSPLSPHPPSFPPFFSAGYGLMSH